MYRGFRLAAMLLLTGFAFTASITHAGEVLISAAASTREVVIRLGGFYQDQNPGTAFAYNFGSSGSLARQIQKGAPAHIYISANSQWMDKLVLGGQVDPASITFFARNSLVVVGLNGAKFEDFESIRSMGLIAMGNPESVPCGRYAEQALKAAGLYETLKSNNLLVMTIDVRQALVYAERGEVNAAFVYSTDALLAEETRVLHEVDPSIYPDIRYPVGLTDEGADSVEARNFFDFLGGEEAKNIIASFGFKVGG
ncbi:MAG: molybdate ABC transporter substrate-binding protein [Deltaproteobacteria bacterium]|nr:MAG: molybdate ABC transporter substrate-binding protein [Deltaproteobacteria bacterium]